MTTDLPAPLTRLQRGMSFRFRDWVRELISPGDSAHELALGSSIGIFVGLTPLYGLHVMIILFMAVALQRLVRFNKAVAIAASYANNPVTFGPLLWASFQAGAYFVPASAGRPDHGPPTPEFDWHAGILALPQFLHTIGWPMLVGCLVLGGVMAVAVYPVTYAFVMCYRRGQLAASPVTDSESAIGNTAVANSAP